MVENNKMTPICTLEKSSYTLDTNQYVLIYKENYDNTSYDTCKKYDIGESNNQENEYYALNFIQEGNCIALNNGNDYFNNNNILEDGVVLDTLPCSGKGQCSPHYFTKELNERKVYDTDEDLFISSLVDNLYLSTTSWNINIKNNVYWIKVYNHIKNIFVNGGQKIISYQPDKIEDDTKYVYNVSNKGISGISPKNFTVFKSYFKQYSSYLSLDNYKNNNLPYERDIKYPYLIKTSAGYLKNSNLVFSEITSTDDNINNSFYILNFSYIVDENSFNFIELGDYVSVDFSLYSNLFFNINYATNNITHKLILEEHESLITGTILYHKYYEKTVIETDKKGKILMGYFCLLIPAMIFQQDNEKNNRQFN